MPYDWILFDADHTLFDFDRSSQEALDETLAMHGIPHALAHWKAYDTINRECWAAFERGEMDRETMRNLRFARFFEQIGAGHLDAEIFGAHYLRRLPEKPYFMDGATTVLGYLQGRIRMGIITNGLQEVQRPRLESTGIHRMFDVIVVSGEINLMKPNHGFFEYTHRHMGLPEKERVLVVGDSLTADIAGGMAYGFRTCWYNPAGLPCTIHPYPDHIVGTLDQILPIAGFQERISGTYATSG